MNVSIVVRLVIIVVVIVVTVWRAFVIRWRSCKVQKEWRAFEVLWAWVQGSWVSEFGAFRRS